LEISSDIISATNIKSKKISEAREVT